MKRVLEYIFMCVMVVMTSACNIDEVYTTELPPKIIANGKSSFRLRVGDEIRLAPDCENGKDATYSWCIDKQEVSTERAYIFSGESVGIASITLTVTNKSGSDSLTYIIDVIDCFKVYDYTPAPGQFIGDLKTSGFNGTETTMEAAIEYAEKRIVENLFVSLGAFGGYIVLGLDHSIENGSSHDFIISGNSFDGSSEPGIVWVMQDTNGNCEPDDTWYELSGSETGKDETIQNYEVTYYRPEAAGMAVRWDDNLGNSGEVEYQKSYHNQDFYYPTWIETDSYTLSGTRLKSKSYDKSGNGSMWINPTFDWGYADNASSIDSNNGENLFDISNAIDKDGNRIELEYIDFVKVQSALQQQCGWLGELSTEIRGIKQVER